MKVSIVITEPTTDNGIGGFEWRVDPAAAEQEYRALRGAGSITKLWHGVDMGDMPAAAITDAVDAVYWDGAANNWGEPARTHAPLALLQSAS